MPEEREQDELQELIGNSRYIPFLHRLQDSYLSIVVKWVANFIIAVFQILNVPGFVLLLIFFFEQFMQKIVNSNYSIPYNFEIIAFGFSGWLLIQFLWDKTTRNIVSPRVFPIWFMNSKGTLKNEFFSAELSRKYSADLEQFVRYQADEYIKEKLREKDRHINRLMDAIEQLRQLSMFPNESFESMRRVVENLVDVVIEPSNNRHQFEVIMDRILVEITTMKAIQPIIRQGSIMLINSSNELRIIGQYNMPNSVVRNRVINLGEKFAGRVASEGEIVWIQDVNTPEAEREYQFEPDLNRRYTGIMGFPIRESGIDEYKPTGVIILHYSKDHHLEEEQKVAIAKVLEVYAQVILSSVKLQNYHRSLRQKYGIITAKEEVSVTFDPGGDTE